MTKTTIQDVAQLARVGVGTVSRVLNNHPSVRAATRQRVLEAIETLGYVPNPHARRIAGGRSYTVSVLLPMVSAEFYIRLLTAVEETLAAQRFDTAIFPLMGRARLERYLESHTLPYQADGVMMITYDLASLFQEGKLPTSQPVVLIDARSDQYDCAFVDNYRGGRIAGNYVAGFEGEVYVLSLEDDPEALFVSQVFVDRMRGFREGLAERGGRIERDYLCALHHQGGVQAARQLLDRATFPCTVFAAADLLAVPLMDEVTRRGLRVGQDVRVVGYDNQPWARDLGLTTVHQPVEEMGERGAAMLLERLAGFDGPARQVCFEPFLIERASSRPELSKPAADPLVRSVVAKLPS
ncbi:LacI family transcriptional regulator [Deinobacterium chartae]|uniref:LacI family transcriptional regulator n=1 Tax=Deinobacterium chartae TaxID=521158 RepID=A0A841HWL2_9DEIO|nr:LacI family DNA-binding transcriptional regulator [Deinobacterium chartae]MBB6097243.1 LacI family transcriptional regulator [Deinobacterium chartae]